MRRIACLIVAVIVLGLTASSQVESIPVKTVQHLQAVTVPYVGWKGRDELAMPCLPGCSGGPVVNESGQCVGLLEAMISHAYSVMLPSRVIRKLLDEVKEPAK